MTVTTHPRIVGNYSPERIAMKDPADNKTPDLIQKPKTKEQRFRERQLAIGMRQYSFWLTESEALTLREQLAQLRGGK